MLWFLLLLLLLLCVSVVLVLVLVVVALVVISVLVVVLVVLEFDLALPPLSWLYSPLAIARPGFNLYLRHSLYIFPQPWSWPGSTLYLRQHIEAQQDQQ